MARETSIVGIEATFYVYDDFRADIDDEKQYVFRIIDQLVIGTGTGVMYLTIDDKDFAENQCFIQRKGSMLWLGSISSPTYLNGVAISRMHMLKSGDIIKAGSTCIRIII